jgi:uncharacterized Tic20 family protein
MYTYSERREYDAVRDTESHNKNWDLAVGPVPIWSYYLVNLTFLGLVIYSVDSCNKETVFIACGKHLWNYMIVRLILGSLSFLVLTCIICTAISAFKEKGIIYCFTILVLVYHLTFIGIGAQVTTDAMKNGNCTSALSDASFTHSPLLAQLGYVFLAFDSLWVLLMIVASCMLSYIINVINQRW